MQYQYEHKCHHSDRIWKSTRLHLSFLSMFAAAKQINSAQFKIRIVQLFPETEECNCHFRTQPVFKHICRKVRIFLFCNICNANIILAIDFCHANRCIFTVISGIIILLWTQCDNIAYKDLFFLLLKSEKSANFEHKRRVLGKGKTENFGCFMAFSRSPNSPNREFKTKKHPSFSGTLYTKVIAHQLVKIK